MNEAEVNYTPKILLVVSFLAISFAMIVISRVPPANGYEISIYEVYPWYLWVLLSIPILVAFLVILINQKKEINKYINVSIVSGVITVFILLSIPFFRGYLFYGAGDIHSHLGIIYDMFRTGCIGEHNPYPVCHLLVYSISLLTGLSIETVSLFIRQLFFIQYIFSMYLLMKSLNYGSKERLFVMVLSFVPVFGYQLTVEYIMPSTEAFLFIPFILYCANNSYMSFNKFAFTLLLIILLLFFPFFHPEPLIYLLTSLLLIFMFSKLFNSFNRGFQREVTFVPILLLFITHFIWFSSTYAFSGTVRSFYNTFVLNVFPATPPLMGLSDVKINFMDALQVIIRTYGPAVIFLFLGGLLSVFIVIKYFRRRNISIIEVFLAVNFIIYILLNIIFLFRGTAIGFHVLRQLKYSLFVATLIIGIYIAEHLNLFNKSLLKIFASGTVFFAVLLLSIYSVFPAPEMQRINPQPTVADISGMEYFLHTRNEDILILESGKRSYQSRFADYLSTKDNSRRNIRSGYDIDAWPLPHFNYDYKPILGDNYVKDHYLLIYPPAEEYYPKIYPKYKQLWRYTPDDFSKLNNDPSVIQYYSNDALRIQLISGLAR
jgi:hypothetical protein